MARTVRITLVDDLDGKELTPDEGSTVTFSFEGKDYEIDLSTKNSAALEKALAKYIDAARRVTKAQATKGRNRTGRLALVEAGDRTDPKVVRAWAQENGVELADRGRIPAEVMEKYNAAQAS